MSVGVSCSWVAPFHNVERAPQPCRRAWFARALSGFGLLASLAGCEERGLEFGAARASAAAEPAPARTLFEGPALREALSTLSAPLPKPIRALSVRVYADRVLLQIQSRAHPDAVEQYRFKGGRVTGPVPVQLMGSGQLRDNLFVLKPADFSALPRLVKDAEERAGLGKARVESVVLHRNLPESMDIRFHVSVLGGATLASLQSPALESASERVFEARKDGTIVQMERPR